MAKSYVKYETPSEIVAKALEALSVSNESGRVRKGANEATKSIEASTAQLVIIAADVEPEEVVMHLPMICQEKGVPFIYVPTKKELGGAMSLPVTCAAVAIEKPGNSTEMIKAIIDKVRPMCGLKEKNTKGPVAEQKEKEKKEAEKEKEDKKDETKNKPKKEDNKKQKTEKNEEKTQEKKKE
jgi:large subunit ribosomal protein L7Ae